MIAGILAPATDQSVERALSASVGQTLFSLCFVLLVLAAVADAGRSWYVAVVLVLVGCGRARRAQTKESNTRAGSRLATPACTMEVVYFRSVRASAHAIHGLAMTWLTEVMLGVRGSKGSLAPHSFGSEITFATLHSCTSSRP